MKKEVLVIVHDAGGAEIISAYIRQQKKNVHYHIYTAGPARKIFTRMGLRSSPIRDDTELISRIIHHHADVDFVLLGAPSCWMTDIERNALAEAKSLGLKTVVYLEWWKDYRTVFGYPKRGWRSELPDEVWVGDQYALKLARKYFSNLKIRLVPNYYFADTIARYRSGRRDALIPRDILFMSSIIPGMERIFSALLFVLQKHNSKARIRLRLHPADKPDRYDAVIDSAKPRIRVVRSKRGDIVNDLLPSRIVIGSETVALAVATLCKIPTINVLPKNIETNLPYSQIIQLRDTVRIKGDLEDVLNQYT